MAGSQRSADAAAVSKRWTIAGQGLAGTCLAWELWQSGADFRIVDRGHGGSSRVAAGLINPITGKNFEPSWRIAEFLPAALAFYQAIEQQLGRTLWHPLPVLRLAKTEKEWRKISGKLTAPDVAPWVTGPIEPPAGWAGAVLLRGGGRLDTAAFLDSSRAFFQSHGRFEIGEISPNKPGHIVRCEGAAGLISGRYGPSRCAKGEILTVTARGWDESSIRIGASGWLVPQGGGIFRAGSTYEWDTLDEVPTKKGRARIEETLTQLGGPDFQVTDHVAGIRPILRRSQPLIGPHPDGGWMLNALGSKGSLYAPGMAQRLANWLINATEPEPELDFRHFQNPAS